MEKPTDPVVEHVNVLASPDRRFFIKGLGVVGAGMLLSTLGGCEAFWEALARRPTRRRIRAGSTAVDNDMATYKEAVAAMKALPASDPRNWNAVAAIHGTVSAGFIWCQHNNNHFFDWHRGYLLHFEAICQKLTGNQQFGLPYWNWNQDPGIAPAFLDTTSTLFSPRTNTNVLAAGATTTAALDPIFADTNFYTFSQQLEGTPHNTVHSFVGSLFGTGGSAADPLFWVHHCMVDYCWYKWNVELRNNNTNDPAWADVLDDHFVDANGNPASIRAGITPLLPFLAYQYESSAIGSHAAMLKLRKAEYQNIEKRVREGADIKFVITQRVHLTDRVSVAIAKPISLSAARNPEQLDAILNVDPTRENVFTTVEYARLPTTSDFAVRVFLNLPQANRHTPIDDPHFAGSFAFFGTALPDADSAMPAAHHHQPKFLVNLTPALERLRQRHEVTKGTGISIQLVAVPFGEGFEREDTEVELISVDVITTPVIVKTLRR